MKCVEASPGSSHVGVAAEAFSALPDTAVFAFDRQRRCQAVVLGEGFTPCGAEEPVGLPSSAALPDPSGGVDRALNAALSGESTTCPLPCSPGRSLRLRAICRRDTADRVVGVLALVRDITELEQVDLAVRSTALHYRMLIELGSDLVSTHAVDGTVLTASASAERLFGWRSDELVGRSHLTLIHPDERSDVGDAFARAAVCAGAVVTATYRLRSSQGRWCWVETTLLSTTGPQAVELHASTRDVSERRELEQQLRYRADHDSLTGAVSRSRFEHDMRRAMRHSRGTAGLLLVDLDYFKQINDTYGHLAGDEVLRAVAAAVMDEVRPGDVVCRWGGDEFAVLLRRAEADELETVAARVVDAVRRLELDASGTRLHVTASVGAAPVVEFSGVDSALAAADRALYRAKANGRDQAAGLVADR